MTLPGRLTAPVTAPGCQQETECRHHGVVGTTFQELVVAQKALPNRSWLKPRDDARGLRASSPWHRWADRVGREEGTYPRWPAGGAEGRAGIGPRWPPPKPAPPVPTVGRCPPGPRRKEDFVRVLAGIVPEWSDSASARSLASCHPYGPQFPPLATGTISPTRPSYGRQRGPRGKENNNSRTCESPRNTAHRAQAGLVSTVMAGVGERQSQGYALALLGRGGAADMESRTPSPPAPAPGGSWQGGGGEPSGPPAALVWGGGELPASPCRATNSRLHSPKHFGGAHRVPRPGWTAPCYCSSPPTLDWGSPTPTPPPALPRNPQRLGPFGVHRLPGSAQPPAWFPGPGWWGAAGEREPDPPSSPPPLPRSGVARGGGVKGKGEGRGVRARGDGVTRSGGRPTPRVPRRSGTRRPRGQDEGPGRSPHPGLSQARGGGRKRPPPPPRPQRAAPAPARGGPLGAARAGGSYLLPGAAARGPGAPAAAVAAAAAGLAPSEGPGGGSEPGPAPPPAAGGQSPPGLGGGRCKLPRIWVRPPASPTPGPGPHQAAHPRARLRRVAARAAALPGERREADPPGTTLTPNPGRGAEGSRGVLGTVTQPGGEGPRGGEGGRAAGRAAGSRGPPPAPGEGSPAPRPAPAAAGPAPAPRRAIGPRPLARRPAAHRPSSAALLPAGRGGPPARGVLGLGVRAACHLPGAGGGGTTQPRSPRGPPAHPDTPPLPPPLQSPPPCFFSPLPHGAQSWRTPTPASPPPLPARLGAPKSHAPGWRGEGAGAQTHALRPLSPPLPGGAPCPRSGPGAPPASRQLPSTPSSQTWGTSPAPRVSAARAARGGRSAPGLSPPCSRSWVGAKVGRGGPRRALTYLAGPGRGRGPELALGSWPLARSLRGPRRSLCPPTRRSRSPRPRSLAPAAAASLPLQ
ncbi:basic proline-rich protein-like [Choloepus didactylus]|uniref:basic proline-rich protein-like n=1 Tax=Choloepus didactylus TaxID=27675 RepID=UPI00189E9DFB|nr:basic proline-rich protein-like [Choloepus didactylus]